MCSIGGILSLWQSCRPGGDNGNGSSQALAPASQALDDGGAALEALLSEQGAAQLAKLAEEACSDDGGGSLPNLLRAVFGGSAGSAPARVRRRVEMFRAAVRALNRGLLREQGKQASRVIDVLLPEVESLPKAELPKLVDEVLQGTGGLCAEERERGGGAAQEGLAAAVLSPALELLPKLLALIVKCGQEDIGASMDGDEFQAMTLGAVCRAPWSSHSVVGVVTVLKDVALSDAQLRAVVTKAVGLLGELRMQELPPLLYQLLVLSTKGHREVVLRGLVRHFDGSDAAPHAEQDAHHTFQGTVLLHFNFAVKQDQRHGTSLIAMLKKSPGTVSPFAMALLMSTCRLQRFESQVKRLLCDMLCAELSHRAQVARSSWLGKHAAMVGTIRQRVRLSRSAAAASSSPGAPPSGASANASSSPPPPPVGADASGPTSVERALLLVVQRSTHGWDHLTQSLVKTGVALLELGGASGANSRLDDDDTAGTPKAMASRVGLRLLAATFRAHPVTRSSILETVLAQVITRSPEMGLGIELLHRLGEQCAMQLAEHHEKVKQALEYISFLTPTQACALLRAFRPLLLMRRDLKDYAIIVLRKAVFSREEATRQIAVSGFLQLLEHCSDSSVSTAAPDAAFTLSQPAHFGADALAEVPAEVQTFRDTMGFLRRCLGQQPSVRSTLYRGLVSVFRHYPTLRVPIMDLLLNHLLRFCAVDKNPPLLVEKCVEQGGGAVIEPLPELLSCVQRCVLLQLKQGADTAVAGGAQHAMGGTDIFKRAIIALNKLAGALQESTPEDFELDKNTVFDKTTQRGKTKLTIAAQLAAAYESCMDFLLLNQPIGGGSVQQLLKLFERHAALGTLVSGSAKKKSKGQAKSVADGGVGGAAAAGASSEAFRSPSYPTSASLAGMHRLLSLLQGIYEVEQDERELITQMVDEQMDNLREYALSTTHALLTAVCRGGSHMTAANAIDSQVKKCIDLSPRLLFDFETLSGAYEEAEKSEQPRLKRQRDKAMECLRMVVQITTAQKCSKQVVRLLDALFEVVQVQAAGAAAAATAAQQPSTSSAAISARMVKLQKLFKFQADKCVWQPANELLEILDKLSSHLREADMVRHAQWVAGMCGLEGKMTTRVASKLASVLLKWHQPSMDAAGSLADSVRAVYGHVYDEDEAEPVSALAFTSPTTVDAVALVLLDHVGTELTFVEYVTKKMLGAVPKPVVDQGGSDDDDDDDDEGGTEGAEVLPLRHCNLVSVCKRLAQIVTPLIKLAESDMPRPRSSAKTPSEALILLLQRLYTLLQLLCKEFTVMPVPTAMPGHLSDLLSSLQELGKNVHQMLGSLAGAEDDEGGDGEEHPEKKAKKKGKASAAAAAKAKRVLLAKQAKQIPKLIFHMEKFDVALMRLQKCWADIDFRVYSITSSVSRDFRMDISKVTKDLKSRAKQERRGLKAGGRDKDKDKHKDTDKSKKRKRSNASRSVGGDGGGGSSTGHSGASAAEAEEVEGEQEKEHGVASPYDEVVDDDAAMPDDEEEEDDDDDSVLDMIVADGEGETSDSSGSGSGSDTDSDE
jgi:Fanconi anemia group I protein